MWALFLVPLCACSRPEEETAVRGNVTALVAESYLPLIQREAQEFHQLYPDAIVEVRSTTTREAIVQLLNGVVRCIVVDRPLNKEEVSVAQHAKLNVVDTKIADDALVVLVNRENKLPSVSLNILESYLQEPADWRSISQSKLSGRGELALTGKNSGAYELLTQHFFTFKSDLNPTIVSESQAGVLEFVATHRRALGIVSYSFLRDTTRSELEQLKQAVRILPLHVTDSTGVVTEVKPDQWSIYHHLYPLSHPLFVYTASKKSGLAEGFSSFVAGQTGQKIIQYASLVPHKIPYRVIQITQE